MATQAYSVPVILPDLRKEESYRQIVDALEYMEAVANDIFNRISCRVAESRDQLSGINNRINVAQAKIDKLRSSSSKATRVFSSPKYPAPERIQEYHTLYVEVSPMLQKVRKNKAEIESRLPEVTAEVMKSKRQPYMLNLGKKNRRRRDTRPDSYEDPEQGEGLGSLPRHLPSISSLLLFNTAENPYKKYVLLDPLSGATTKTRDNINEEENELSEAPFSITQGEELGRGNQDSIMYVPVMPELPELEVPDMLPQLLHVAADEFYQADVGKSIAPSLANAKVPELPNLADPEAPAATVITEPPTSTSLPEPAPPPPPPPPVEPPPPPLPQLDSSGDEGEPTEEESADTDGGRANLMEAIRKAGGSSQAGLKDTKKRKHKRKSKKVEEEVASGGDLLDDLTAALSRRRKAMSGKERDRKEEKPLKEESHNLGGGSMMDNISRLIPAPPPPGAQGGRHGGADDEADDAAW